MLAKSHEKLSPHYELDQQHTVKAIQEYALYMDLYQVKDSARIVDDLNTYRELLKINPDNLSYKKNFASATAEFSRIDSIRYAGKAISQLREKLARNSFSVAKQYVQLKKYKAAAIFYDEVIRRYPDTIYFQPAWAGRIDVMIMRKKWFDASQAVDHYLQLFPDKEHEMVGIRHKITQNQEKN